MAPAKQPQLEVQMACVCVCMGGGGQKCFIPLCLLVSVPAAASHPFETLRESNPFIPF